MKQRSNTSFLLIIKQVLYLNTVKIMMRMTATMMQVCILGCVTCPATNYLYCTELSHMYFVQECIKGKLQIFDDNNIFSIWLLG